MNVDLHLLSRHEPAKSFAAFVRAFFTEEHLVQQRAISPRTVATYTDAFVLFLDFAVAHLRKQPTAVQLEDISPTPIGLGGPCGATAWSDEFPQESHRMRGDTRC